MLKAYYRLWVDAIVYQKTKAKKEADWKLFLIIAISIIQGFNLLTLLVIIRALTHRRMPVLLPVNISNMAAMNGFFSIMLTFLVPFLLLNYLLIFYNDRYQALLSIYPNKKGMLFRNYFIISVGIVLVPLVIKILFF